LATNSTLVVLDWLLVKISSKDLTNYKIFSKETFDERLSGNGVQINNLFFSKVAIFGYKGQIVVGFMATTNF